MLTLILVPVLTLLVILFYVRAFKYQKNTISCAFKPKFPFGNLPNVFTLKTNPAYLLEWMYVNTRSDHKVTKFFLLTQPFYMANDPHYIKNVLQSDFESFSDRGFYYNERDDPISANLFALDGSKWSSLRGKLSPAFTSGKLKIMFETMLQCALQMKEYLNELNEKDIDVKEMSTSYSIDVIGSCAFGLDCNCFKNDNSQIKQRGREIFEFSTWKVVKTLLSFCFPNFSRSVGLGLFGKSLNEFFVGITRNVITHRTENCYERKDMMQLLIKLYQQDDKTAQLNYEEITAQVFIFFAAGFETSSITLTYCLYELSVNETIQERLKDEINEVLARHNDTITYDAVMEMKYMTQVIEETLRKYPPVPYLFRRCVKKYNFPKTDHTLDVGDTIFISVLGLHHDPRYFPEPKKFDPDRFSTENKSKLHSNVYMPFGEGPRICIGLRFAMIQLKIALAVLLTKYKLCLSEKTSTPIPVKVLSFTLMPAEKVFVNFYDIKKN